MQGQTGQIVYVGDGRKASDLFIKLLERLKGQYRRAKRIELIIEQIIRNHYCKNMDDLLKHVYYLMNTAKQFLGSKHGLK